jgi:hypothetical protein
MSKPRDIVTGRPDDPVEEALDDHHLAEVAEMIERAHADESASESPTSDSPAEDLHGA